MNPKRKQTQDFILKYIDKLVAGKENTKLYQDLFDSMSDEDFDQFMQRMRNGEVHLSIVAPNDGKTRVSVENNFSIAKELGHEFFQRVKVTNHPDYPDHILPIKSLTMMLPIRRAQQLLSKKISVPEHNLSIDQLTGQVSGRKSRSSKITYPEQQILLAMGLKDTATELVKYRGGDVGAAKLMNDLLIRNGEVSQREAELNSTGVISTQTLAKYLVGMHISSEGLLKK